MKLTIHIHLTLELRMCGAVPLLCHTNDWLDAEFSTRANTWCVQVLRSPKEAFAAAMPSWRERCEKCVCLQGDYVEK